MEAAVVDTPAKGSRFQLSVSATGSPSGWAKKITLRPLPCPLKVATTLSRSPVSIARALANSPTIGTSAGPVAHRLHRAAQRARRVGDEPLHRRLAVLLGADQGLQEADRISHLADVDLCATSDHHSQSCTRRRAVRTRIRLKVV